jgi:3-oxoadipate enol-lactonase
MPGTPAPSAPPPSAALPPPRYVQAGQVRLAYRAWLPAGAAVSAPPVVLLHATGEQSADWSAVAPALAAASWPVYAPDLRGHGASDWPGQYTMAAVTADVAAFCDALRLAPAIVIGHSLGGAAAYQFAAGHPDRVRRLILEDPAPPWPLPPRTLTRPAGPLDFDWDSTVLGTELRNPPQAWRDALGRIAAPTLIIAGGPASHVDQERLAEMASLIPRCELITIPAGHLVHAARPGEFTTAVTGFLTEGPALTSAQLPARNPGEPLTTRAGRAGGIMKTPNLPVGPDKPAGPVGAEGRRQCHLRSRTLARCSASSRKSWHQAPARSTRPAASPAAS